MTSPPLVSICIPTYNRARYLESLLTMLEEHLPGFPYSLEIVIADNASPDRTPEVVAAFRDKLPIRYIRHDHNIGGFPNFQFVLSQGTGRYVSYLADDDCIIVEQLASTIAKMEADPEIAVVYAPWYLHDLVADKLLGQFYTVPHDLKVARHQHGELLDHVLRHHIFPEVQIVRREAMRELMPRINEHAFFAFVHAADYLSKGAVLIQQQPFYTAITNYFADEVRTQVGNEEVEYAWDRYRGGLEYMLARAGAQISTEERAGFHLRIQRMIAVRMAVAVRLRYANKRNAIDTYYIAARIKGMGYESELPVPLPQLAKMAALEFLLSDPVLNRGIDRLVVLGPFEAGVQALMKEKALCPVVFVDELPPLEALKTSLVFVSNRATAVPDDVLASNPFNLVRESELVSRFGM